MALSWTTTELLAAVRAVGSIPDADPDATDAKLLLEANRQMDRVFVPLVRKARSEYYVCHQDYDLEADVQEYRIPPRASTSSVRAVLWLDQADRPLELSPVPLADKYAYSTSKGAPERYTIQDEQIVLLPTPSSGNLGKLRIVYERRPSTLVLTSACNEMIGASTPNPNVPNAFLVETSGQFADNDILDVVGHLPPFSLKLWDAVFEEDTFIGDSLTAPTGQNYRIPVAGDWLCFAGESPIPQIPAELHPWLATAVAAQYLLPTDGSTAGRLLGDLAQGLQQAEKLLTPRQQGRQQKIKSRSSYMRRGGVRRRNFSDWVP